MAGKSDRDLFHAEDGLIRLYEVRKSVDWDTADIEASYRELEQEMASRGLVSKGLTSGKSNSGPPRRGQSPSQDDGINHLGGNPGKGGEANRTQRAASSSQPDGDGDDDNPGHDTTDPSGKAKRNKGTAANEYGYTNVQRAAPTSATSSAPAKNNAPNAKTTVSAKPFAAPLTTGTETPFADPVSVGRQTPAGRPAPAVSQQHPFAPSESIAAICGTCGRPIADHVGSYTTEDAKAVAKQHLFELITGEVDVEAPVLKRDFSDDERQQYAQSGVALADGSFPIPDEASLHNAVRLVGQAQDPQAAMHHIIERAKAMGMTHALPPAWNVADAGTEDPADAEPQPGAHGMSPNTKPNKPSKSSTQKALKEAFQKAWDAGVTAEDVASLVSSAVTSDSEQYAVFKSAESRYTMGPVYMPGRLDAHDEWTTAEELQKATWDYVSETGADRTIYLQHSNRPAGQWVEIMQWPQEVKAVLRKSVDGVQKQASVDFPAGTVYMGVRWEPWAWEMVKSEKITGFSMGGWARRLELSLESLAS